MLAFEIRNINVWLGRCTKKIVEINGGLKGWGVRRGRALIIIAPLPIQLTVFKGFLSFLDLGRVGGDPAKLVEIRQSTLREYLLVCRGLRLQPGGRHTAEKLASQLF